MFVNVTLNSDSQFNYGLTLLNGFSFLVIFLSFYSCVDGWLNCQLSSARYYSIITYLLTYLLTNMFK